MSKQTVITHYDSIGDFRRVLDTLTPRNGDESKATAWTGGESWASAKQNLLVGKMESVPKASALLDQLAEHSIELEQTVWEPSVAGAFPLVPAFLSGQPETMLRPVPTATDRSPVRVYASVCCSAGVDADDLEKRGIAILALCQKLGAVRPIELFIYADMGGSDHAFMPCVKVETSPLDLATATFALTSAGFLRQLCFGWANQYGWGGGWAWGEDPTSASSQRRTREALGLSETDLLVPGGFVTDPLIRKPVEWINEKVAFYTKALDE